MIYASDQALLHVSLDYETPAPELPDASTRIVREVVAATYALARDWLGPVGIGYAFVDRDRDSFYEERPPGPRSRGTCCDWRTCRRSSSCHLRSRARTRSR